MFDNENKLQLSEKEYAVVDFETEDSVSIHFYGKARKDHGRITIRKENINEFIKMLQLFNK